MLIDSHCHLLHGKYQKPLDEIIKDAENAGVTKIINVGTCLKDNLQGIALCMRYDNVYTAIGIYPHEQKDIPVNQLKDKLEKQLGLLKKIVAIGECGLDISNWENGRPVDEQIEVFKFQLDLALQHKLPVIIHNRGGDEIIFDIIEPYVKRGLKGVAHCFSTTQASADKYLDLGFYISFSGMITYKSRNELREVSKNIPDNRFLVETDSPLLPPEGFRGQPNEPKHVVEVAKKLAEVRGEPFEKVCELSYSNTCNLFAI